MFRAVAYPQYVYGCWPLLKVFGVPPLARKAKPFVDHILTFSILDSKIWFRNFQVRTIPFRNRCSVSRIFWHRLLKRTPYSRTDLPRCHWWRLVPGSFLLRFAYLRAPSAAQRSIQIQVRAREPRSKFPTDPRRRIRHAGLDTRGDEASEGESLRSPPICTGGEDRTEREPPTWGGSASRIQDIRLANGVVGYLPCLEEQRGFYRGGNISERRLVKICRAGVFSFQNKSSFFHPLPCDCHHYVCASRSRLVRYFGPIVSHCPLKTALTSFSSRRPPPLVYK